VAAGDSICREPWSRRNAFRRMKCPDDSVAAQRQPGVTNDLTYEYASTGATSSRSPASPRCIGTPADMTPASAISHWASSTCSSGISTPPAGAARSSPCRAKSFCRPATRRRDSGTGEATLGVFGSYDVLLPKNTFLQFQAGGISRGTRRPHRMTYSRAAPSARASAGASAASGRRCWSWSPIANLQRARPPTGTSSRSFRSPLNTRQHIRADLAYRVALNNTAGRANEVMFYSCGLVRRRTVRGLVMRRFTHNRMLRALVAAQLVAASMLVADDARSADLHTVQHFQTSDRCIACHNGISHPRERTSRSASIGAPASWPTPRVTRTGRRACGARSSTIRLRQSRSRMAVPTATCRWRAPRQTCVATPGGLRASAVRSGEAGGRGGPRRRVLLAVPPDHGGEIGDAQSFSGGFVIGQPTRRRPFGVRAVRHRPRRTRIMQSSTGGFRPTQAEHIRKFRAVRELPHADHHAFGPEAIHRHIPEQVPYQEWLHSEYHDKQSCQPATCRRSRKTPRSCECWA